MRKKGKKQYGRLLKRLRGLTANELGDIIVQRFESSTFRHYMKGVYGSDNSAQ